MTLVLTASLFAISFACLGLNLGLNFLDGMSSGGGF